MTDRIDHAAEARRLMELAGDGYTAHEGWTETTAIMATLDAQTHATLALVEQQRIANLIALTGARHRLLREQVADDAAATLTVAREHDEAGMGGWHELSADVAAALGIEVRP